MHDMNFALLFSPSPTLKFDRQKLRNANIHTLNVLEMCGKERHIESRLKQDKSLFKI